MIEEPARRPDDDGRAARQRALLGAVGDAAVDRDLARVPVLAEGAELARHLERELAGWDDDERLRAAEPRVDPLEDRDRERGRLSRAGLRLREEVAARLEDRDGLVLDRGGRHEAEIVDRAGDVWMDRELAEASKGWSEGQ